MINKMLCFGLVFIPFYEVITTLFLPAQSIAFFDTRFPKECVAFTLALIIALYGLYRGIMTPLRNKWLMFFVAYLVVSLNKVPIVPVDLGGFDISNFWVWKPFMMVLVYLFMLSAIISLTVKERYTLLTTMAWCGFIMALYIFIQKFGLDQFFYVRPKDIVLGTAVPALVGTMGGPSAVAPMLAICLIPAIFLKKAWFAMAISVAAILTQSDVAIFAGIAGILVYLCAKDYRKLATVAFMLVLIGLTCLFWHDGEGKHLLNSNGRLGLWETMAKDLSSPFSDTDPRRFSLTGFGLGSFEHVYNMKHPTNTGHPPREAHNEYLELIWCVGVLGAGLFLTAVWRMLYAFYALVRQKQEAVCLFSMFIVISICAAGTYVWHLAVYQFYTVVIVGMMYSMMTFYQIREE